MAVVCRGDGACGSAVGDGPSQEDHAYIIVLSGWPRSVMACQERSPGNSKSLRQFGKGLWAGGCAATSKTNETAGAGGARERLVKNTVGCRETCAKGTRGSERGSKSSAPREITCLQIPDPADYSKPCYATSENCDAICPGASYTSKGRWL